jgi:transcriptional regulator with XRE-family HTH domain
LGYLQRSTYDDLVIKRRDHGERYLRAIGMLRAARKDAHLSQTELAAKLGRRQQFVSKYESGERRLDMIEFLDVATALNLDWHSALRDSAGSR